MIGTLQEAKEVHKRRERGSTFLGSGATRRVYRAPSGVVYKLNKVDSQKHPTWNEAEAANFDFISQHIELPPNWFVPEYTLHVFRRNYKRIVVLATHFIDGPALVDCWNDEEFSDGWRKVLQITGLGDTYEGNCMKDSAGRMWIVDAADYRLCELDMHKELIGV